MDKAPWLNFHQIGNNPRTHDSYHYLTDQQLRPSSDAISPNRSGDAKGFTGWAFAARTQRGDRFLIYFEQDCPTASLAGAQPGRSYRAQWFNPRNGKWSDATMLGADAQGRISLPPFPDTPAKSDADWALKLSLIERS